VFRFAKPPSPARGEGKANGNDKLENGKRHFRNGDPLTVFRFAKLPSPARGEGKANGNGKVENGNN
jgi:hypothetical protein